MLKLKSLTFEALRGATRPFELKFESGKKIVIVFGENGSGKSTICDALDLLGNEDLSSLKDRGLTRPQRYWHSTKRNPADIKITLAATEASWSAHVVNGKCVVAPFETCPKVKILRRHQILSLLAGRASDRYQALQPFLAIDSLENSERALRDLINATKRNQADAVSRIGENLETLENVWKQAGSPGPDIMIWAEAESLRSVEELNQVIVRIQEFARRTLGLSTRLTDLKNHKHTEREARELLHKTEAELSSALTSELLGGPETLKLLQAAHQYFQKHEIVESCPLCDSREFVQGLPQSIEERLNGMELGRRALELRDNALRQLETATAKLDSTLISARLSAMDLVNICIDWPTDLPTASMILEFKPQGDAWSNEELDHLVTLATNLNDKLEPELARRLQIRTLLQTVRDALSQYKQNLERKAEYDALLPRLERAHEIFVSERRNFVDEILRKIATRVGELYEEIHPKEGLSKISLQLDPARRASLDVMSEFHSAGDTPPTAYLSESHLDTLGIAIFLALAELENPSETILVLDDVVASVDEPHVDRIINMLYDVSQNFAHCLITTHYQPWREKFRWGKLRKGECQFIELGPWTIIAGLVTSKTTPRIEVLRAHVEKSPPEPADICASAGVFLERILNFLADQYECSVPRRRGKPALRDLLQSVKKNLRTALRVELHDGALAAGDVAPVVHLGSILDKVENFANIRNVVGCHFDEIAGHLNPADAVEFGTMVLELADALIHPEHGWPTSDKSGEYWSNTGKSRRLYPLKQPA